MKRLVDRNDPDDEVVRLLIRSGANHQPAPGSKMRLMAALGVGSAVGLSASKVLAWLGTSSGKVALAVSVVGTAAGGAYVMARSPVTPSAAAPAAATFEQATTRAAEPPAAEPILEPASSEPGAPRRTVAQPLEQRTAGRAAPSRRSVPPAKPASVVSEAQTRRARLSDETTWVDQLRVAAERQDRPAFERLLEQYTERFPEGQLHPEVNRLETSLR